MCGKSKSQHDSRLEILCKRLHDYNVLINEEKSTFGVPTVDFVGHTVSANGVRPLKSNVEAIQNLEVPTTCKKVRSLLGAANFYRKFIPHFSDIVEPLVALTRKEEQFEWSGHHQRAFDRLKESLTSAQVLAHFDPDLVTLVTTDASGVALGAYLSQIHHDGVERTVAFASRTLSPTERAYSTSEREALACMWACEHWHYYLYGRRFTLRTDHSALKALLSGGQKGRKPMRLLRWADRLQQYDYEIQYRPGSDNVVADLLSRSCETSEPDLHSNSSGSHHNLTKSVKTSNSNHCIIDLSHIDTITYMNSEEDLQLNSVFGSPALATISPKRLAEATAADPLLQSVITLTQTSEWKSKPSNSELLPYYRVREELSFINGTLFRGDRAVIPTSLCKTSWNSLTRDILDIVKMKSRCRDCTWWPGMDSDIEHHVLHCEPCQLADKSVHAAVPPMTPIRRPDLPWSRVSVDIKGELHGAPSNSRYLLVAYDLHSKWPEVRPVSSISSIVIITWLRHLFSTWGLPDEIITDNGRQFTSQ